MRTRHLFSLLLLAFAALAYWLFRADHAVLQAEPEAAGAKPSTTAIAAANERQPAEAAKTDDAVAAAVETSGATPYAKFDDWSRRYLAASGDKRDSLRAEGVALARERRTALAALIPADPREALQRAVPMKIRQDLPPEVVELLEERVNERGFYGVLGIVGGNKPIRRHVKTGTKNYEAHVYGTRERQKTTELAYLNGIAIDRALALDERPLRVLEAGERPSPSKPAVYKCPVSKKETKPETVEDQPVVIDETTPAVEAGGTIHYLCSGGHIAAAEEEFSNEEKGIAQEGSTGGAAKPTGNVPTTSNTGVRTHLYMRVTFPDQMQDPQNEASCYDMMRQVDDFIRENSFGKCYFLTTVTPLLVLPRTEAWYKQEDDDGAVLADARAAAKAAGYDPSQYNFDTVRYSGGPGSFGGQAYVGGKGCWMKTSSVGTACHEYGHNLGLWHANYWSTSPASVIGPGTNAEYGNSFDTMGAASAGNNHFGAYNKNVINWMSSELVTTVRQSGTYRIFQHDQAVADPARRYGLKIAKDNERNYWAELRQKFTSNAWMTSGLQITWDAWGAGGDKSANGSNAGPQLLDLTPGTPDGKNDSPLMIGRTFTDPEAGVHITPIGKGSTTPESMDVVVNLGNFPGNIAPTLSLTSSVTAVATSASVSFTASAADPDGDVVAYAWDFGDKSFSTTNLPVVTKSWSTAGRYVVRCTASDMKGGVTTRQIVVTVGTVSTFTISGTVLSPTGQPLEGVLISNGQTSSAFRGAYTDSSGNYVITNLAAGSHTISAAQFGYSFTPGFTNPVAVGPNATAKNFSSSGTPSLSIVAVDATAREGTGTTDTGRFRISRTGSTASAKVIRVVNPSGTATKATDYTMAPDPAYNSTPGAYELTIPAGAAFLDVVVTTANDTTQEGPETVNLQLVPITGMIITGSGQATITIDDDDTALPRVRITANDEFAGEGADPAQFTVSRTGATTSALTLALTVTGTATNGNDYATLGNVTIPAGATAAVVNLVPVDDVLVEGNETATLTIASNSAAYVRDSTAQAATATINDNDVNLLTITATDATASENGDTATFTITRTGDLTNALTVDYVIGGTAMHGTDYLRLPGLTTIPAGYASTAIMVVPVDDNIGEASQTIVLQLRSKSTYQVAVPVSATATLTDNDGPAIWVDPSNGISTEPASGVGTDTARFRINRAGGNTAFTAFYTISGTATAGLDYTTLSGSVAFAAADTFKEVTVTPLGDSLQEGTETVILTLSTNAAYLVEPASTATVLVIDQDAVTVHVSTEDVTVSETSTAMRFWFSRTGATTAALNVSYTMAGTATAGADYTGTTGTVTIPAGAAGVYLSLVPVNDTLPEGTESVTVQIAPVAGGYVPGVGSATYLLGDNDNTGLPQVRFAAATSNGSEGTPAVNIGVTLSAVSAKPVTVNYAVTGGTATAGGVDYTIANGVLTFDPGITSRTITANIINDNRPEENETVIIGLTAPYNATLGTSSHTYTINDNDPAPVPTVSFVGPSSSVQETSGSPQTMLVALSAASTSPVSVDYTVTGGTAASPSDYALPPGRLTFAAGEVVKFVPISIVADEIAEANETVVVTLSAPSGATIGTNGQHTLTIEGVAATITVAVSDSTVGEPGATGAFTLTRSGSTTGVATVSISMSGTAVNGADYQSIPSTINFAAGQSSAVITIVPLDDLVVESDETVTLTVNNSAAYLVGSPATASFTLTDDDRNQAPSFTKGANVTVSEDSIAQTYTNWGTNISAGPGESTQNVTFTVTNDNTALFTAAPAITASGTLTFTAVPNGFGSATVSVQARDNGGTAQGGVDASAIQTFTVTVLPVNDPPSFTKGPDRTVLEDGGAQVVANWAASISPGPGNESSQEIQFVISTDNPSLFTQGPEVSADGRLSFTPAPNANGTAAVTVRGKDNGGIANAGSDTSAPQVFTINVTPVNDVPSFVSGASPVVDEDSGPQVLVGWASQITAGPGEAGQAVTFTVTNNNPGLFSSPPQVATNGALSFTPAPNAHGIALVSVALSDDGGADNGGVGTSPTQTFAITVNATNDAPTLQALADISVRENADPLAVALTGITTGAADETDTLTITAVSDNPALIPNPTVDYLSPGGSGSIALKPALNRNGSANITVTVGDGQAVNGQTSSTFAVTVLPVNNAPTFTKGDEVTVNEDAGPQSAAWASEISVGPDDESAQKPEFLVTVDSPELFAAAPAIAPDGTLTYTPAPDAYGVARLKVKLRDDGGTSEGGTDTSAEENLTITIGSVNDVPSFAKGANQEIKQNGGAQVIAGWATEVTAGPANEADQTLDFLVSTDRPELFTSIPAITPNGALSFTPSPELNGVAVVTVRLRDSGGTSNGGVDTAAEQTFIISSLPVNDAPSFIAGGSVAVAQDAGAQTMPGWATSITVGPADEMDQTWEFLLSVDNAALFSVLPQIAPDGTLTFTPLPTASGKATVTVQLRDSGGTADGGIDTSPEQTLTIAVTTQDEETGTYNGLATAAEGTALTNERFGAVRVVVRAKGVFSGYVKAAGRKHPFKGTFDKSGNALFSPSSASKAALKRKGLPDLLLGLQLDVSEGTNRITGQLEDGGAIVSKIQADRALYTAKANPVAPYRAVPTELLGRYNVIFAAKTPEEQGLPASAFPQGNGIAVLTVSAKGVAKLKGTLADGTPITCSGTLSQDNRWPLYVSLHGGLGSITTPVSLRRQTGVSDLDGPDAVWIKPAAPGAKRYPNGWPTGIRTDVIGARFVPSTDASAMGTLPPEDADGNAELILTGGNLSGTGIRVPLNISAASRVTPLNTSGASVIVDPKTGAVSGKFAHPLTGKATKFKATVLQPQGLAAGFFLGTTESGSVELAPTEVEGIPADGAE